MTARFEQLETRTLFATTLPAAPLLAFSSTDGVSMVKVSWMDSANNEDGYVVERAQPAHYPLLSTDPQPTFSPIATLPANTTLLNDSGLSSGYYVYRVHAFNNIGDSRNSNQTGAVIGTKAAAPTNVSATLSGDNVTINWQNNATNATQLYVTRERVIGGVPQSPLTVGYLPANTTSFTDSMVPAGNYCYVVSAVNTMGLTNSSDSNMVSINVNWPAAPAGLSAGGTLNAAAITKLSGTPFGTAGGFINNWYYHSTFDKAFDGNTATGYAGANSTGNLVGMDLGGAHAISYVRYQPRIEQAIMPGTGWPMVSYANRMVGGAFQGSNDGVNYTTFYTISSLPIDGYNIAPVSDATAYRYVRYKAVDGSWGDIGELEFYGNTASESVSLNWSNPAGVQDKLTVERSADGGGSWALVSSLPGGSTSASDVVTNDGNYYYRVGSTNGNGTSFSLVQISVTLPAPGTPAPAPAPVPDPTPTPTPDPTPAPTPTVTPASPTNLTAKKVGTGLSLVWKDNSTNETGFVIQYSLDGKNWLTEDTVGANVTSFTATPRRGKVFYRVWAVADTTLSLKSTNTVNFDWH